MFLILQSMPDTDRQEWLDVLADESISHIAITRALRRRGHDIGRIAVQRYRMDGLVHREP